MPAFPGAVLIPLGRLHVSRSPLGTRCPVVFPTRIRQPETSMVVPNEEPKKRAKRKKPTQPKREAADAMYRAQRLVIPIPIPASKAELQVINPDAAGIDVHSDMHMVCVSADRDPDPVRQFGANTADLHAIVAWLKKCGVKTVALESTGVYWIPLYELLESEGFEAKLVEPGQLSRCGARPKTDVLDAQWIRRLHCHGLLRESFRPPDSILALSRSRTAPHAGPVIVPILAPRLASCIPGNRILHPKK